MRTAYRWAHQVRRAASRLIAGAVSVAQACGDTTPLWLPARPAATADALTAAVCALGGAASAWTARADRGWPKQVAGSLTGIDYLGLLARDWQGEVLRRLRVADPAAQLGDTVTGWPLITAVVGGRLLTG